jgi:hypothetical protein
MAILDEQILSCEEQQHENTTMESKWPEMAYGAMMHVAGFISAE